ncbi:EF-P 5-aminopentanol modification-associated protein YfmF [Fictibacillus enclensis]|uniref:EF-P 5-aminopentanol modification-associated protein YfmF n=1 Tax=Fictibacillus enclensis TaxID=1017270 RepID=UPI0024C0B5BD|nr:pitrilysin family protein [Fictibacillus enclensis]WHY74476.1 pitrilysin family protein [Fictibacillus enclensis]
MTLVDHHVADMPGMTLHTIETTKYKTTSLILQIKSPITEEEVTKRALLPYVLQSGTERYPSSKELRGALDGLYGATLGVDLSKKGEYQIITLRMDVANEKFLSDNTPLLDRAFELLSQVLLKPAKQGEGFLPRIVQKEKRSLKQQIESIYDDKMRYANKRLIEEMFDEEPYRFNVYGNEQEVDSITPETLYDYYQKVMKEDEIHLFAVGDVSRNALQELAKKHFVFPQDRMEPKRTSPTGKQRVDEVKEVFEEQEVQQGKLHMGYRTYITYSDPEYLALQVFNGVFGGFSHSKLFMNVREKESLAYYAASRFESHKGIIFVMSGIETKNYEKTVKIINEQLEEIRNGNITDGELEQTKAMIRNQILETVDDSTGLVEVLYHEVVSRHKRTIEEWLEGIQNVTKEQVRDVSQKIQLDTIYFLKGRGE